MRLEFEPTWRHLTILLAAAWLTLTCPATVPAETVARISGMDDLKALDQLRRQLRQAREAALSDLRDGRRERSADRVCVVRSPEPPEDGDALSPGAASQTIDPTANESEDSEDAGVEPDGG